MTDYPYLDLESEAECAIESLDKMADLMRELSTYEKEDWEEYFTYEGEEDGIKWTETHCQPIIKQVIHDQTLFDQIKIIQCGIENVKMVLRHLQDAIDKEREQMDHDEDMYDATLY